MEYTILPHGEGQTYTLSLIVRSKEDHKRLHDNLMCRVASSSKFVGDVFTAGSNGDPEAKRGKVFLEPVTKEMNTLLGLYEHASEELARWDKEVETITDRRDEFSTTGALISALHKAEMRREEWRSRWSTLRQAMRIQNYEPITE